MPITSQLRLEANSRVFEALFKVLLSLQMGKLSCRLFGSLLPTYDNVTHLQDLLIYYCREDKVRKVGEATAVTSACIAHLHSPKLRN